MIPTARLNVAVDKPSSDGRYWGRYPAGNAPIQGAQLSGNAPLFIAAGGSIITAIKLAGAPLVAAAVSGALSTQIRLAGGAAAAAIGSGTLAGVTGPGSPPTKAGNVGTPLSVDLDTIFQNAQSYTLVGNPLPTAISMSGGLRNHLISGTPSTVQSVSPTIRARDTQGYTTNFSLTENLSEGNTWVNNGGGSWTPCVTTPGLCCGTNGANNAFDDSDAHYPGCGTDYTIIAKIHRAASIPAGETHEVELCGRCTTSPGSSQKLEADLDYNGNFNWVRWNGPFGNFTVLSLSGGTGTWGGPPQDGEFFCIQVSGSTYKAWKGLPGSGTLIGQVTDTTYPTGDPGVGFFKRTAGVNTVFGFSQVTITSP